MNDIKVKKNEDFWKHKLTPDEFQITRKGATESPFTGEYNYNYEHLYQPF